MAYTVTQKATVGQLKALAIKAKSAIDSAIQALPTEMFLDQAKTAFISSFAFNSTTYPGATDPSLNGKPVLVLAVKGIDHNNNNAETTTYSFLDVSTLVDTYTVKSGTSARVLNISGYQVEFKLSATTNNALTANSDGLYVNITGKADKVASATANDLAMLDANGNLVDSGIAKSTVTNYATQIAAKAAKVSSATNGHLAGLNTSGDLTDSGIAASTVAIKVTSATTGHVAGLDASGNPTDTGIVAANILTTADVATDAEVAEMLTEVFGA